MATSKTCCSKVFAHYGLCLFFAVGLPRHLLEMFQHLVREALTTLFSLELAVNMWAHEFKEFWASGWNVFDAFIVAVSLLSLLEGGYNLDALEKNAEAHVVELVHQAAPPPPPAEPTPFAPPPAAAAAAAAAGAAAAAMSRLGAGLPVANAVPIAAPVGAGACGGAVYAAPLGAPVCGGLAPQHPFAAPHAQPVAAQAVPAQPVAAQPMGMPVAATPVQPGLAQPVAYAQPMQTAFAQPGLVQGAGRVEGEG